jgi:hypothetical protein
MELRTCRKRVMLVAAAFVAAKSVLGGFIRCKVDSMRGSWATVNSMASQPCSCLDQPAPMTTLDKPLHNDQNPSAREMVTMAFEIPVYMALGDGLTICILVFGESAHRPWAAKASRCEAASAYLEQVYRVHDRVFLWRSQCMQLQGGHLGGVRRCLQMRPQAYSQ